MENYIVGRNAVKEALRGDRSVQRLLVADDKAQNALRDIVTIAKKQGIEVRLVPQNNWPSTRTKSLTKGWWPLLMPFPLRI